METKDIKISSLIGDEFFSGVVSSNGRPLVLLIDGNNFCIRAFYSVRESKYRKTDSPMERCFTMLMSLLTRLNVNAVVFCFDGGRDFRERLISSNKGWIGKRAAMGYKGQRTLRESSEYPEIQQLLADFKYALPNSLGIPAVSLPGVEADDLLFAFSRWFLGMNKLVLSADEDLVQCCLNPNTTFFSTKKEFLLRQKSFAGHCGYPLPGYARLKAVVGDSSDNIEGVYGIAEISLQRWYVETQRLPFHFPDWIDKHAPEKVRERFGSEAHKKNWAISLLAISLPYFFNKVGNTDAFFNAAIRQLADYTYSDASLKAFCSSFGFALSALVAASSAMATFHKQQHGMALLERTWNERGFNRQNFGTRV